MLGILEGVELCLRKDTTIKMILRQFMQEYIHRKCVENTE